MAEEKITSFADIPALNKEYTTVLGYLKDLDDKIKNFKKLKSLVDISTVSGDFEKLLEKFLAAADNLSAKSKKVADAQKAAADSLASYKAQVNALTKEYELLGNTEQADISRKQAIKKEILSLVDAHESERKELQQVKKGMDAADQTYYQLQNQTSELSKQLKSLPGAFDATTGAINKNNQEAVKIAEQIRKNNDILKNYDESLGQFFRNVGNYKSAAAGFKDFFTQLTGFITVGMAAAQATRFIVNSNIEISDSLTEVQRVAGLTTEQTKELYDQLKKIDTRTSLNDLLNLAKIGGQLGVPTKELGGFTKALNDLTVALGGEIQGGPEDIATRLGKVINLMNLDKKFGLEDAMEKTGSAILAVGQAGIATGDYLSQFAASVGGVARAAHISLPNLLAYGATLEANGVAATVAGTAFTNIMTKMASESKRFYNIAKVANPTLTFKQFTDYINNDGAKAIQLFFEGINAGGSKLTEFATIAKSLGIPGRRATQVLLAIAGAQDDVAKNTQIANQAFDEGTLAIQQAKLKNNNLAGAVAELKNEIVKLTTDPQSDIGNFFKEIVDSAALVIRTLNNFSSFWKNYQELILDGSNKIKEAIMSPFVALKGFLTSGSWQGGLNAMIQYRMNFEAQIKKMKEAQQEAEEQPNQQKIMTNALKQTWLVRDAVITAQQKKVDDLTRKYNESASLDRINFGEAGHYVGPDELIVSKRTESLYNELQKQKQILEDYQKEVATIDKAAANKNDSTTTDTLTDSPSDKDLKAAERKRQAELKAENSEQIALDKQKQAALLANAQKEAAAQRSIEQETLQNDITTQQNIMNDSTKTLDERLAAFKKYVEDEKKLLETQKNNQIQALQDTAFAQALKRKQNQALLNARKKKGGPLTDSEAETVLGNVKLSDSDKKKIIASLSAQEQDIILKYRDQIAQWLKTLPKMANITLNSGIQTDVQTNNDTVQSIADAKLEALNQSYKDRSIAESAYNEQREDIEFKVQKDILQNQIDGINKYIAKAEAGDTTIADSKRKLAELEMQLSDLSTQHTIKNEEEKAQKVQEVLGQIQQFGDQFIGILDNASQNRVTAQKNALQQQIDAINNTKQAEIDAVNETLLSQQEKANKVALIDARSQAQSEALQRRQQQLDEQQAKFDKAKSIFDIILSTAEAIAAALKTPWEIPIIAALGAAELAVAAAQPIPQYEQGTDFAPEGYAIVGEKGHEIRVNPDGTMELTPSEPSFTYLQRGTKILPNEIFEKALNVAAADSYYLPQIVNTDIASRKMEFLLIKNIEQLQELKEAIKNIPIQHTNFEWTERGVRKWIEKNGNYTKWVNKIIH